jgi:hypothetical protein
MAKLGINTGIVPDDGLGDSLLDGAVKINDNFDEIYTYFGDGTNLTFTTFSGDYGDLSNTPVNLSDFSNDVGFITSFIDTDTNYWTQTSSGIHTLSNVGIGTTNPTENLTVFGDARVTGILTIGTASITLDGSSNIITVGSGVTIDGSTGIIEATSLVIEGTTFTGAAVTSITAGTGISVDQSTGNVTISATGGGGGGESYWTETSAGIHTLSNVGIGTTNPTSALTVKGNTSLETLSVSGVSTFAGITTVTGTTFFTKQLNVSGVSTFNEQVKVLNNLEVGEQLDVVEIGLKIWNGNAADSYLHLSGSSNEAYIRNTGTTAQGISINATGSVAIGGGGPGGRSILANPDGSVSLELSVVEKLRTIGAGVTVTGTTFTNQLSVSGISTLGTVQISSGIVTASSGIVTYYGDTSYTTDGRWTLGASGTSDYTFTGIGFTQTTNDPVLYLARGRVYEFVNNSGGSHPFQIRVSNGGAAYNDGVTNNGAASGVIRFEIPFNAPNTLYYQCTVHSGMGNTISVYPNIV